MKPRLGFIGLGTMGRPMARHLLDADYQLAVYNRTPSRAEELVRLGAVRAATPREVAECADVVITCLLDDVALLEVVLGADGVIDGIREGSILVDTSTVSPVTVRRIARELETRGAKMLDAPVTRGSKAAREGSLAFMVGGDEGVFQQCRPIFGAMGKDFFYMGEIGMGATAKVVNNLLAFVNTASVMEAFALGVKAGVDAEALFKAISVGSGNSYQVQQRIPYVLKGNFDPVFFSMHGAYKDVGIATSLGRELGVPLPFGNLAQQLYEAGRAAGLGDMDAGAVVLLYERLLGIEVREKGSCRARTQGEGVTP